MKKLHLELDALRVESFSTADESAPKQGTVRGHAVTDFRDCWSDGFCTDVSVCLCNTTVTAQIPECGTESELCP